jgi:hypothetical protein
MESKKNMVPLLVPRSSLFVVLLCFQQRQPSQCLPFTQVISDVDDTIKSSGGVKIGDVALGGIDTQYERGEFYPG